MSDWHGYFHLQVSNTLTGPQLIQVGRAILDLGRQNDTQPAYITHYRIADSNRAMLGECVVPAGITRGDVVTALANRLGVSVNTVSANIVAFSAFAFNGTREASRQGALAFLSANSAAWDGE